MSKSANRRASQSRPLLGKSECFIQSPCSRQRMRILVSARLQATAAPEAPEPMMRTSTFSCGTVSGPAMSTGSLTIVAPQRRPVAHRVEQGPVALFQDVALGEGRARLVAQRPQDAVVAIIGGQHQPAEPPCRPTAGSQTL